MLSLPGPLPHPLHLPLVDKPPGQEYVRVGVPPRGSGKST